MARRPSELRTQLLLTLLLTLILWWTCIAGMALSGCIRLLVFTEAFGIPTVVRYQMKTQAQIDRNRSLNRQGVDAGAPTILVEIGQNGSRDAAHVTTIVSV